MRMTEPDLSTTLFSILFALLFVTFFALWFSLLFTTASFVHKRFGLRANFFGARKSYGGISGRPGAFGNTCTSLEVLGFRPSGKAPVLELKLRASAWLSFHMTWAQLELEAAKSLLASLQEWTSEDLAPEVQEKKAIQPTKGLGYAMELLKTTRLGGCRIRCLAQVPGLAPYLAGSSVAAFKAQGKTEELFVIALWHTTPLSFQCTPVAFSPASTIKLIETLKKATDALSEPDDSSRVLL